MIRKLLIASVVAAWAPELYGQQPITPAWIRSIPSSTHETRLALDHETDRLHLAIAGEASDPRTHIRAFSTDGSDIPPPYTELVLGSFDETFAVVDHPLRLLAMSDTLYYVEHLQRNDIDFHDNVHRAGSITLDSVPLFNMLVHGWGTVVTDIHHDDFGELVASPVNLSSFTGSHWLSSRITTPTTDRIAANQYRVYGGRVPSIAVFDRDQMIALAPIMVPSSGTSTRTLLMLNDDVLHYASLNNNLTMDIGAVNTTGGAIWNSTLNVPQYTTLSGITFDALGNLWVAASQGGTTPMGLLFRFDTQGSQTGNYTFGRTIDDIVCSGNQVFLSGWDAVDLDMVYLAAFATDITTSLSPDNSLRTSLYPNPASSMISIQDIGVDVERISVMDATGRSLIEFTGSFKGALSFSTADLAPGSYLIRLAGPAGNATLPFQVAR